MRLPEMMVAAGLAASLVAYGAPKALEAVGVAERAAEAVQDREQRLLDTGLVSEEDLERVRLSDAGLLAEVVATREDDSDVAELR